MIFIESNVTAPVLLCFETWFAQPHKTNNIIIPANNLKVTSAEIQLFQSFLDVGQA